MEADLVRSGGVEIHLDHAARVARFRWDDAHALNAENADVLIPKMDVWVDGFDGAFGFLIDGSTSYGTAPGGQAWMDRWAAFHARHSPRGRVAVFLPTLFTRGRLVGYQEPARTPLRLFASESLAREWLAEELGGRALSPE